VFDLKFRIDEGLRVVRDVDEKDAAPVVVKVVVVPRAVVLGLFVDVIVLSVVELVVGEIVVEETEGFIVGGSSSLSI
jgi:hypothetical protein